MASEIQKQSAISNQRARYKVRGSYLNTAKHINDDFLNLGFDYRGKIFKKMTSPEIWANPMNTPLYGQLEALINFLIEQVKYIKKTFSIAHDKNTLNIN
jgi:hypothetical protein